jgi:cbb3-type cytochrome oxidase subunit 1
MGDIMINRDGTQYGPYTLAQVQEYLAAGNLVPSDFARTEGSSSWVAITSLPGISVVVPPPPVPRQRQLILLILMAIVWWFALAIVTFFGACFMAGLVAGMMHPGYGREAGRAAGQFVGTWFGLPIFLVALGLSIWLTVIGKLPGTRKY